MTAPEMAAPEMAAQEMAEPRKIFRIEKTAARRVEASLDETPGALRHAELMQELSELRAALADARRAQPDPAGPTRDLGAGRLASELHLIHGAVSGDAQELAAAVTAHLPAAQMTRIAHELGAVIEGSEQATQKILAAAEEIDQAANSLSAALKGRIDQGLAQDIQDVVIRIFEACNFQDLTSQRVTKVMATLKFIEDHIVRVLQEIESGPGAAAQFLHGPRLAIDSGHATQSEIDALFGDKIG